MSAKERTSLRVGVVFGGRSVEHRVSVVSARSVARGLRAAGHEVVALGIAEDGGFCPIVEAERALAGELDSLAALDLPVASTLNHWLKQPLDAIFPIAHGTFGEDGCLQGFCELLDLPYVGPGVLASAVCMDKVACKQILGSRGIQVVDSETVSARDLTDPAALFERVARLGWPCFVKPATGGSSVGVVKVRRQEELLNALECALRLSERALVERAVIGRELEVAVLGYRTIAASGIGEIVPGKEFYDYADKYLEDGAQLIHRADLPPDVEAEVRRLAVEAFEAVAGVGLARIDFFYDGEGNIWLNEINTLPGFTAISMYPKLWELAGVALPDLVDRLVRIAQERHGDQRRLNREIKAFIASLT